MFNLGDGALHSFKEVKDYNLAFPPENPRHQFDPNYYDAHVHHEFDLLVGLLLCAVLAGSIQEFPLFSHLNPEACRNYQRKVAEAEQAGKSLPKVLGDSLRSLTNDPNDFQSTMTVRYFVETILKFKSASDEVLIDLIRDLKGSVFRSSESGRNTITKSRVDYYYALILSACYLKGIGTPVSKTDALKALTQAYVIPDNLGFQDLQYLSNLVVELRDVPGAYDREVTITIRRLRYFAENAELFDLEKTEKIFMDFIKFLPRFHENEQEAQELQTIFIAKKLTQILQNPSNTIDKKSFETRLESVIEKKDVLPEATSDSLEAALLSRAETASSDIDASGFYEKHARLAESAHSARMAAEKAWKFNQQFAVQEYNHAISLTAEELDLREFQATLNSCRTNGLTIYSGWYSKLHGFVCEALQTKKSFDMDELLALYFKERVAPQYFLDLYSAKPEHNFWDKFLESDEVEYKEVRKTIYSMTREKIKSSEAKSARLEDEVVQLSVELSDARRKIEELQKTLVTDSSKGNGSWSPSFLPPGLSHN